MPAPHGRAERAPQSPSFRVRKNENPCRNGAVPATAARPESAWKDPGEPCRMALGGVERIVRM